MEGIRVGVAAGALGRTTRLRWVRRRRLLLLLAREKLFLRTIIEVVQTRAAGGVICIVVVLAILVAVAIALLGRSTIVGDDVIAGVGRFVGHPGAELSLEDDGIRRSVVRQIDHIVVDGGTSRGGRWVGQRGGRGGRRAGKREVRQIRS